MLLSTLNHTGYLAFLYSIHNRFFLGHYLLSLFIFFVCFDNYVHSVDMIQPICNKTTYQLWQFVRRKVTHPRQLYTRQHVVTLTCLPHEVPPACVTY